MTPDNKKREFQMHESPAISEEYANPDKVIARLERELEQAKERERQLREALTSIHQRWVDGPAEWHMMAWAMNSDAEAALTVPPAKEKPESYRLNSDPRIYDTDGPTEKTDD